MELESIIGIEIHVQLKTNTKMFSRTPSTFGLDSNTQILPLAIGFSGTLPVVNKKAVLLAIKICSALKLEIAKTLYFDRKNYFYPDLPKGYQITQQFNPIGKNGHLELLLDNGEKLLCHIDNAHLEEDTAKQIHLDDISFVNYNRAGIPLLEIVSCPDLHTGEDAMKYVETPYVYFSSSNVVYHKDFVKIINETVEKEKYDIILFNTKDTSKFSPNIYTEKDRTIIESLYVVV